MKKIILIIAIISLFICEVKGQQRPAIMFYNTAITYNINDLVAKDGIVYKALVQTTNTPPHADWAEEGGSGASAINDLTDVIITTPANQEVLTFNGTNWVNQVFSAGSETDPIYSAWNKSTGISITESQISDLAHTANTDNQTASQVPNTPSGNLAATDVQEALNELQSELDGVGGGSSLPVSDATSIVEGSVDATKELRFEVDGLSTATTRVITMPDSDIDLGELAFKDVVPITQSTSYTTNRTEKSKHIDLTTGATVITLDDANVDVNNQMIVFNNTGGALSFAYGTSDVAIQGALPDLANGYYVWLTLKAANSWSASVGGTPSAASPLTTKGDVYSYSTGDARLGVGTNGQVLTADSAEATGLKWATVSGAGDVHPISDATAIVKGSVDGTKLVRIEADGIATATTRVITMPDENVDLGDVGLKSSINTWAQKQTFDTGIDLTNSTIENAIQINNATDNTGSLSFSNVRTIVWDDFVPLITNNSDLGSNTILFKDGYFQGVLKVIGDPTVGDHIGNQDYNDGRYVNKEVIDNIEETTASRTIAVADMGNVIYCQSSSATTISIPDTWALVRGTTFTIVMEGTGQVTLDPTGTTNLNGAATSLLIDGQWGTVQFIHLDDNTDDWHVLGKIQ